MSEFEKWYKEKYYKYDLYPKYAQFRKEIKEAWQAAITEANKRIEALEGEVAEANQREAYESGLASSRYLKIAELQVSNHDLREALLKTQDNLSQLSHHGMEQWAKDEANNAYELIEKALSATPAESLAKRDDEVLERAAKVAMDMPSKADEIHDYRYSDDCKAMAWDISHAIRSLKEVK